MNEKLQALVGAKISEFRKKMAEVKKIAKTVPNKIVVNVEARIKKTEMALHHVMMSMMTIGMLSRNIAIGSALMVSPAVVPILVALVAAFATLGPMIGTVAGSTFALVTAFGFAGSAAIAFGAAAIPTIAKLFSETEKLTKAQKAAKAEYTKFQKTWQGIIKDLEKPVLEAFGKSMQFANKVLKMARPLFDSAATAVNNLLNSLNQSLDSSPVKAFFDYMNKQAGPMLETTGKAIGNFMQGFMSMMTAFGPLSEDTAQGFLKMSQSFADWAAGLSKSEKFQTFVTYIKENMPKIKSIFSDALAGISYFFAAFGPLSSDMLTSLQNMMGKFKEWSATLSENQQFQKFIGYIRDNAPKVITLIGNLTNFLINLGVGLAPIGSAILGIVNNILSWTNSMMSAHPIVGQIISALVVLIGGLILLAPQIIAVTTLFSGLGTTIISTVTKILPIFNTFKSNMIIGLKMMMQSLGFFVVKMQAKAVSIITSLGKVAAKAAVTSGKFILYIAKMGAKYAWLGVQALIQAGRIAASWLIAMGPVGWVIATVIALVILIIANWDKVKSWTIKIWTAVSDWVVKTAKNIWSAVKQKFSDIVNSVREKMNNVKTKVQDGWNKVMSFLKSIDLMQMGKDIIQGLINGIGSMASSLVDKAKGVVGDAIEGAKKLLKIGSPSKVFHQFGKWTGEGYANGMNKMKSVVGKASQNIARAAMIEPQRTQFAFDSSLSGSDFGRIRRDIGAEVSGFEMPDPTINVYNEWDGEKVVSYVERGNAKRQRITDGFGGK